jgi:hypothetical protein
MNTDEHGWTGCRICGAVSQAWDSHRVFGNEFPAVSANPRPTLLIPGVLALLLTIGVYPCSSVFIRGEFRLFNWLVYWIIGRLRPFLLRLFCYAYITAACILQVIYRREPKNLWNHHYGPIISL